MPPVFQSAFLVFFLILFVPIQSFGYLQIEFLREISDVGKKAAQRRLNEPRAIALDAAGKMYIADTAANRVIVLEQDGTMLRTWGTKGDKPGQFRSPSGIAVDEDAYIYVSDTKNHRIQVFNAGGAFVRNFGQKGDGDREFSSPAGIAVRRGLLYVADTGNNRVQILTTDGIFVREITVSGEKDAMNAPTAVAIDTQNRIYVLDTDNNKIRIFDSNGAQLLQFGSGGRGAEGFDSPLGMAVDGYGAVYVSDTGNYKLKKFDQHGKLVASAGSEGDGPGRFRQLFGLAVDAENKLYVLDAGRNALQVFSCECEGQPLQPASPPASLSLNKEVRGEVNGIAFDKRAWALVNDTISAVGVYGGRTIGSRGSEPGLLKNPRGLAFDDSGRFWVADTGNDRLQKFSIEGNLLQVIGRSGSGEGEFRSPSSVAISTKGNIFVADTGNKRVQVFSGKGMFLGAFGKSGKTSQLQEPVDLAVTGDENVYVVDRATDRVAKYDGNGTLVWEIKKTGKLEGEFNGPTNISVSPEGELYVLDAGNSRIQVFDTNGQFLRKFGSEGEGPGQFKEPQGLALDGGLRLYVGDRGNSRVQIFTLRQTPAMPKEVTAQSRSNEVQLNWKGNGESYLEQYTVYRSDAATGPFKVVGTAAEPFFVDKGLASNRAFYYAISSKAKEGNESVPSPVLSAVTPKLIPSVPKKVKIEALEKQITLSWLPNLEPFMNHYAVYRSKQPSSGFELLGKADRTVYVDTGLADETFYYYQITAVGKEGDESPTSEVVFISTPKGSLSLPPIEISKVEMGQLFSSAYKYYESHPLGKVIISNNTDIAYPKVKLSFSIKDFMDFPTELEIENLPAKQQRELLLKPVFNNKILEVTENTPLQSEIAITFYAGGEPKTVARTFPVMLYERHAMVWDVKAKLGAFVTAKDTPVVDFSRSAIRPYVDAYPNLHQSIIYARVVFDALGVLGLKYIIDPSSPFQDFSENSAVVDYVQYPRDTLTRKSGDCDDLSILFAACMENIGIETAFIDVPGHVFIMFNTGISENEKATLGFPDKLVSYQGTAWVPVEMTMVGSSFTRAWQKAAEEYREWSAKGKADIVSTEKAWELFKPATLPHTEQRSPKVSKEEIEAKFKDELESLGRQRLANLSTEYLDALKKKPNDTNAMDQLGILYGENGLLAEALEQFQKILAVDKNNAQALNNIGNINFLQERLEDAKLAYEGSLKASPDDTGVMVNLARVLLRMGKKSESKTLFENAISADPRIIRQHGDMSTALGIAK